MRALADEIPEGWTLAEQSIVGLDAWEESAHPRGQPENKGQFGSGGGGGQAKAAGGGARRTSAARSGRQTAGGARPRGRPTFEQALEQVGRSGTVAPGLPTAMAKAKAAVLSGANAAQLKTVLSDVERHLLEKAHGSVEEALGAVGPDQPSAEKGSAMVQRRAPAPEVKRPDATKVMEKATAEALEKATPEERKEHAGHVDKVRSFFSSDGGRAASAKAVKDFAAKHAAGMAKFHLTDAILLPAVHQVVEHAVTAIGLGGMTGVTLGATAVAAYAVNHLMDQFNFSLGGAKEVLGGAVRNAIDVLGGVKEVASRIAELEKAGQVGDAERDDSVLDALILLLLAIEETGEEQAAAAAQALDEAWNEGDHPRGQPENAGEFAPKGKGGAGPILGGGQAAFASVPGGGGSGEAKTGESAKPDIRKNMVREFGESTQPVKSLDELYERSKAEEPAFRAMVEHIAEATGSKPKFGVDKQTGSILKTRESSERKLKDELGGDFTKLRDVLRGTVVGDSVEKTRDAAATFIAKQGDNVLRVKDRHVGSTPSGYRDILVNFRTPGGLVAELQFNSKAMAQAKEEQGHKLYDSIRTGNLAGKSFDELQEMARTIYEKAYEADGDGKWGMQPDR
jgi:hypothetical protein